MKSRVEHLAEGVTLYLGDCRDVIPTLGVGVIDAVVTSPPYNLGSKKWDLGGEGRKGRSTGIGYDDDLPHKEYVDFQVEVLRLCYQAAKQGASFFYNHKLRTKDGHVTNPFTWLKAGPWIIRQEIVWDRGNTHNFEPSLFWNIDERIWWLTKGKPTLGGAVGMPTIWRIWGPVPNTDHPAPFREEIPYKCLEALRMSEPITVLDPFNGSGTTGIAARKLGHRYIGIEKHEPFFDLACKRIAETLRQPDLFLAPDLHSPKQESLEL